MDMNIESTLREIGLTDGEVRVYIALVELGSVTVGPIIRKAHISSSKVYVILEKLIQKGLVSYIIKEKTKYFQVSQAVSLIDYVEIQEQKIQEVKSKVTDIVSYIRSIKNSHTQEEARIYRGYKGLKTAWVEAISSIGDDGEYYFFSVGYGEDSYLQRFFKKISLDLKKRKIKIKGIANVSEKKLYQKHYKKLGYDMRYTDMQWPSDITIAGDTLLMFTWDKKEPVVYSIQSKVLVSSYYLFMKSLWDQAKR